MKNDDFKVIVLTKKFILSLKSIVELFPNKERVLRDKLYSTSYDLLENIYYINNLKDYKKRIKLEYKVLSKISFIDFLIEQAYYNKYISEKKCLSLSKSLTLIYIKVQGWIKSDNKRVK